MGITYTTQDIITARTLTRGSTKRGTIDLTTATAPNALWADLEMSVGRSSATALSNGVDVLVRRMYSSTVRHMDPLLNGRTTVGSTVGIDQINNGAGYAAGTTAITVDSITALGANDQLLFWGTATDPSTLSNDATQANAEFCRLSLSATTVLTLDTPCLKAKIDNEYVTDQAEHFTCRVVAGAIYEVVFDYGDDGAGDLVLIQAIAHVATLT